jgi:hypothetical protein
VNTIEKATAGRGPYPFGGGFRFLHAFSGWLMLYLAIGAISGMAFWEQEKGSGYCIPKLMYFATLATDCSIALVNGFWFVAVSLPRLAVIMIAMPLAMTSAGIKNGSIGYFLNVIPWLKATIPLLLLITAGTVYWWVRSRAIAMAMAVSLLLTVSYLAYLV